MGEGSQSIELSISRTNDQSPSEKHKQQSVFESLLRKTLSPERATEFFSGQMMMSLEIMHDMALYPAKYTLTPNQVGTLPNPNTNPVAAWAIDHIGDMWEISAGFTAMRLGFVAANEVLKKIPVTKGYQIPDEACFWASLTSACVVTATHSLGMWAGPYNSHVGHPVPEMIFGQGVAAVVLATSHYAAKYREPIKDLALRVGSKIVDGGRFVGKKLSDFETALDNLGKPDLASDTVVDINKGKKE